MLFSPGELHGNYWLIKIGCMNMNFRLKVWLFLSFLCTAICSSSGQTVKKLSDINIRDPYIMPHEESGYYYMYKSASVHRDGKVLGGVEVYKSKNLSEWEGPVQVFTVPDDNWITGPVWAPEVHAYNGKYYLFATLNSDIEWKKGRKDGRNILFEVRRYSWPIHPKGPSSPLIRFHIPRWIRWHSTERFG